MREGLADHAPGKARKVRPVRAELKFHRDPGNDSKHEVDTKDPGPETRGLMVSLVVAAKTKGLEHYDERREPHRELGKEVVKGDSEGKMQAMN